MKRLIIILVPVIAVCAGAFLLFFLFSITSSGAPAAPAGKVMSIESYVAQNISNLSPIKESVGGTFQVTKISTTNPGAGEGTGVVSYDDGHNAYTADFAYDVSDQTGITIKTFKIRK